MDTGTPVIDAPKPTAATFRPLPLTLKNHGYTMRQVRRSAVAAIYSKGGGFEVIRIRKAPETVVFGNKVEAREVYPGDEMFGSHGWYYVGPQALELATAKFAAIDLDAGRGGHRCGEDTCTSAPGED